MQRRERNQTKPNQPDRPSQTKPSQTKPNDRETKELLYPGYGRIALGSTVIDGESKVLQVSFTDSINSVNSGWSARRNEECLRDRLQSVPATFATPAKLQQRKNRAWHGGINESQTYDRYKPGAGPGATRQATPIGPALPKVSLRGYVCM